MRKYITKASERIGVESTSRDGKRAQVVSYSTCENFIIRFCDGKEMKLKNWRYFIEGNFNYEKHFKAPRNREERIGEKKVMNNGLTAEVIEYRGSHDMDILFEDGGKRTGVSWRDFCIGNIAHPTIHGGNVSQNELVLRFYLESLGFVRIPQRSKRSDRVGLEGKELDLYNDKLKIAIEYDGEYSHTKNKDDEGKNKIVEKLGIKLYRFREPGCSGVSGRNYILEDSRFMSASLECCLKSFVRDVLKKDDKFINFEKDKRTIKEYVSNNKRATIHLYEKKKMNNGMVAEIIKMSSCRNITVQFEDGEIVYHKCYQSFVKGNISHAGYEPLSVLVEKKQMEENEETSQIMNRFDDTKVSIFTADFEVLTKLTGFKLTRGMLCAMRRKPLRKFQDLCDGINRIAILENVQNPTNVGAIFRSAAALNMEAVLLSPGCSDPLYRRASRVSMGTVFQIPWTFIRDSNEMRCKREVIWPKQAIAELKKLGYKTAALALTDDSVSIDDSELMKEEKLAVILGNEGEGLENETIALCDYTVKIPMTHGVDSLNVAAASAVAFWQLGKIIL